VWQVRADQDEVAVVVVRDVVADESLTDAVERDRQFELRVVVPVEWKRRQLTVVQRPRLAAGDRDLLEPRAHGQIMRSAQVTPVCLPQSCKTLRVPCHLHGSVAANLASLHRERNAARPARTEGER